MKATLFIPLALLLACGPTFAGDDASGPVHYSVNLAGDYDTYQLSEEDLAWSGSLARKFKYSGPIVHFVRTSLRLTINDVEVKGAVYQAMEKPDVFYVVPGDAMLKLNTRWPYSPGVGGFSMHAPPSRNYIVCLNFQPGGVPFLSSSRVTKGIVSWGGHNDKRI